MELFRALGALAEPPSEQSSRIATLLGLGTAPSAAEYTELFVFQLPPYASVYVGAEGMLGGEARDRIAGFWRALGEDPPAEPDHLTALLGLYARLTELAQQEAEQERSAALERARAALLWEHLLSWLPGYLDALSAAAPRAYVAWGELLQRALEEEASAIAAPDALPLHLREAALLESAELNGADGLSRALLAPVRSGMLLTRSDLARAAGDLGLGLRAGERRFVLRALLDQDAARVLRWLVQEARAWARRHAGRESVYGDVVLAWSERAARTAETLEALSGAEEVTHAGSAGN
jgi:TorA maturation chaperone TorD